MVLMLCRDGDGVVSGIVMVVMSSGGVGLVVAVMVPLIVVTVLVTESIL